MNDFEKKSLARPPSLPAPSPALHPSAREKYDNKIKTLFSHQHMYMCGQPRWSTNKYHQVRVNYCRCFGKQKYSHTQTTTVRQRLFF